MECRTEQRARVQALIDAAVRGEIDEAGARRLYHLGPEAVILALLTSARRLAELQLRIAQLESREPIPGRHDASLPGETSKPGCHRARQNRPLMGASEPASGQHNAHFSCSWQAGLSAAVLGVAARFVRR